MSAQGPKRVGQIATEVAEATRVKYGRSPANAAAEPLPGHEDDVIPELPDYWGMKEHKYAQLAENRADERRRLLRTLPRKLRLLTYTRQRLRGL